MPHAQCLQGRFHEPAPEAAALVSRHGADLRGVADPICNARIQDHPDHVIGVRSAQDKGSLGLELPAAGQDDDVFQKAQRSRFAAILIVDFTVNMVCIRQLDQPGARLEIPVVPPARGSAPRRGLRG